MRGVTVSVVAVLAVAVLSCSILVPGPSGRPDVDAGSDRCVGQGEAATLTAAATGTGVLHYRWSVERMPDGVEDVAIQDETAATATTSELTVQGVYVFRVVVTDPDLLSTASFVSLTVGAAGAGGDFCVAVSGPASRNAGEEGAYAATTDRQGTLTYAWDAVTTNGVSGEEIPTNGVTFGTPDTAQTTAVVEQAGKFTLRVTVTDEDTGEKGIGRIDVVVAGPPELSVRVDGPETAVVDTRFQAAATVENATGVLTYAWEVTSGAADLDNEDMSTVGVTPTAAGDLELKVVVTDEDTSRTASATWTVSVAESDVVTVTASSASPLLRAGNQVALTASIEGTFDDVQYEWSIVDGPGVLTNSNGAEATLGATAGNTIQARVTVRATRNSHTRTGTADVVVVSYEAEPDGKPEVVIEVEDFGTIGLAMEVEAAPNTVANFLQYVDEGFYNGVLFHRVVSGFVIQSGGFLASGTELTAKEATRPPVESEAPNGLSNTRGTVAMALRGQDANSGDTQFFINLADNSASLDTGPPPFTVFAQVVRGMDVVDAIAALETATRGGMENVPVENVVMTSVRRAPP